MDDLEEEYTEGTKKNSFTGKAFITYSSQKIRNKVAA
jgi:hypothetical protein